MCKTCNGQGGLEIEHKWGIQFKPCPDSHCDFDREEAWKKTQQSIKDKLNELDALEKVSA